MQERERIIRILEENKALLEATNMDVSESLKGYWFFTRYNPEHDYFDAVVSFKTADELAKILLGEIALDIFTTIDGGLEELLQYRNLADDIEEAEFYKPHVERLMKYYA